MDQDNFKNLYIYVFFFNETVFFKSLFLLKLMSMVYIYINPILSYTKEINKKSYIYIYTCT